jgi:TatD DNase family protein
MIFDTHCHGYWHGLKHRQNELRRNMRAEGVSRSVQIGTDLPTSRQALALARNWAPHAWCAIGIHPSGCQDFPMDAAHEMASQFEKFFLTNRKITVAIGETGLDYYHLTRRNKMEQIQTQRAFFQAQAALASRLDLPLVIHTRDAAEDTIAQIKEFGIKRAVIHCFSEDLTFARRLLEWSDGIYFSFSGILTYPKSLSVQNAARDLPLNRILVETDAPFLVPQARKDTSKINEPAFTRHVMDFLKTLRPESGDLVEQAVWDNSNAFFGVNG